MRHQLACVSGDIGMSFGLKNCNRMVYKRGNKTKAHSAGHIADSMCPAGSYKYLGINHKEDSNIQVPTRIKQFLKSQSMGRIRSTPSTCMPYCPTSYQIPCLYSELAKGRDGYWCEDSEAHHNVWRFPPPRNCTSARRWEKCLQQQQTWEEDQAEKCHG